MDWKTLITELQSCGYSQASIGKEIGKSQVYIADIAKGRYADLKWSDGQALIRLHKRITKQKKAA